ncbi:MAG: indolepyruvate ferredoxin oxidoreductase subunit beta [Candidatus Hydrothermarchaeota archaeon]|nr:MAG: indolepyruvate ferredoxin oxidoreductase subunit beta [Candidatus Hydrothermarchaeota archaeon]
MTNKIDKLSIIITGVGGQGILLASNVLGKAAIYEGYNVIGSETHGMAQRGGSVVSHVRIGNVFSPLIPKGKADYMLAFEPLEALRNAEFLNEKSIAIVNTYPIIPTTLRGEVWKYPKVEKILTELKKFSEVMAINASELARKAGSIKTLNVVMLGALASTNFPLKEENLKRAIREIVPPKTIEINMKAFELGKIASKSQENRLF